MNPVAVILKLLGCIVLAFVGYYIMAAIGWPAPLDSMSMERGFVGGAFMLLAALCAVASILPERKTPKVRTVDASLFDSPAPAPQVEALAARPFWTEDVAPVVVQPNAEPEVKAAPEPVAEHPPEPEPESESQAEPEPAPTPEPAPVLAAPSVHPASVSAVNDLLAKGDKLFADGEMEEALDPYSEALDKARALHSAAPSPETLDLIGNALKSVGDVHDEVGRLDPATEHYEEALKIRTAQLSASPVDPARKRALSLILERLGDTRETRGHTTRALGLYRQSLPLAESLAQAEPENPIYAEDLATTRRRIAELEARLTPPGLDG